MRPPIVILTDFGTIDPFVGIMKGVITQIAPEAKMIDLTHEIPPGDIRRAALALWQSVDYFPSGSTYLVVVDPGVGTSRRAMIAHNGRHTFITPDNGVLSFVIRDDSKVREISNLRLGLPNPGRTFHGRDIFAPAAAHASLGIPISEFGNTISDPVLLPQPKLDSPSPGILTGQILHSDRFGNLLTSLGTCTRTGDHIDITPWIGDAVPFAFNTQDTYLELVNGKTLVWANTFADIPQNECAVILGSSGLLEIVANRQSATNLLNLQPDEPVTLRFKPKT